LYIDVDGRRYPRKHDYLIRAEQLCNRLQKDSEELERPAHLSVSKDSARMLEFLEQLERGDTRGVALFSGSAAGLWEQVLAPRPLRDRVAIAPHPYVLPLEALLEMYQSFCTVIVDREKARILLAKMGRIREESELLDDVPGQHDQGGWSQARYQRHIEDHVERHFKHVADALLRYLKRGGFDHLILAGPQEVLPEFERQLHDYVKRRIVSRTQLAMTATAAEVLERSLVVEAELERRREREIVERLVAGAKAGRNAVLGLPPVLDAVNDGRVDTLVVPFGLEAPGVRCTECGRLAERGSRCRICGGPMEPLPDLIEEAVGATLRLGGKVESVTGSVGRSNDGAQIGAVLRF
jgi:peptide chain release factor subunit 1